MRKVINILIIFIFIFGTSCKKQDIIDKNDSTQLQLKGGDIVETEDEDEDSNDPTIVETEDEDEDSDDPKIVETEDEDEDSDDPEGETKDVDWVVINNEGEIVINRRKK